MFDSDVFISYAHLDNQAINTGQNGWIDKFHEKLKIFLQMRLGKPVEIWRDPKLAGNDLITKEIEDNLFKSALLVSILSPRYLESEWCMKELTAYCDHAEDSIGIAVNNSLRVFLVLKSPAPHSGLIPDILSDTLGYTFYEFDKQGVPIELDSAFGKEYEERLNIKIARLAWEMTRLLKNIDSAKAPTISLIPDDSQKLEEDTQKPKSLKSTNSHLETHPPEYFEQDNLDVIIHLASCGTDRIEDQIALRTEFIMRGYKVLTGYKPISTRSSTGEISKQNNCTGQHTDNNLDGHAKSPAVNRHICEFSVHLLSEDDSYSNEPESKTLVQLDLERSALTASESRTNLYRIISLPAKSQTASIRKGSLVDKVRESKYLQTNSDVMDSGLEDIKNSLFSQIRLNHQQLQASNETKNISRIQQTAGNTENTISSTEGNDDKSSTERVSSIYIVCTPADRPNAQELCSYLVSCNFNVNFPLFEGSSRLIRETNIRSITQSDGVVIYYGNGDKHWNRSVSSELIKIIAAGSHSNRHHIINKSEALDSANNGCSVKPVLTYVAGPNSKEKEVLVEQVRSDVVDAMQGFSHDSIASFLNSVLAAATGREVDLV